MSNEVKNLLRFDFSQIWFQELVSSLKKKRTASLIKEEKITLWSSAAEQISRNSFGSSDQKFVWRFTCIYTYIWPINRSIPAALTWKIPLCQAISFFVAPRQTPLSAHVRTCTHWQQRMPNLPRRLHSDWMSDAADSCTHHSVLWIHYLLCSSKHWFISLRPKSKRTHVPAHAEKKWKKKINK